MTEQTVTHATFVLERTYDASPAQVFAAFADPAAKSRWFAGPDGPGEWSMDFRVGGRESNRGGPQGGPVYSFDSIYQDIVPNARIIYTYDMHLDAQRISVSVATFEFRPEGSGTHLVFTEQGAFLDGLDKPEIRQQGSESLLDALGAELSGHPANV